MTLTKKKKIALKLRLQ